MSCRSSVIIVSKRLACPHVCASCTKREIWRSLSVNIDDGELVEKGNPIGIVSSNGDGFLSMNS